ncbi:hypothetical protein N8223_02565 [Bacteroidia bacterium]|nr:hypothetical protein [Bacteroidia bacterium]
MNRHRSLYISIAVVIIGSIYILRLFQIQVLDDSYKNTAERISLRKQTIYPQRGLIFDRENKLVVFNEPVYDLMVSVPIRLGGIDTNSFCGVLGIDRLEFDTRLAKAKKSSYRGKAVFMKNVSNQLYARMQERLYEFKGLFF